MSVTDPALNSGESHPSLGSRIVRLLKQPARLLDRRTRKRLAAPPLRAYLGMIGTSAPYPVANISSTGFFMLTDEQWNPGTCLPLRLERTDRLGFAAISRVAVQTCVARKDSKGVGFAFLPIHQPEGQQELGNHPQGAYDGTRWADQGAIDDMLAELESLQASGHSSS
jgi:hypothetical protein